jgi:sec-independent protein translocase protein TatC
MTLVRPIGHEDRLSLVEHLDELRTRLIVCVAAFFVCFAFCYWQNSWLLHTINEPLRSTQRLDGKKAGGDPLEQAAVFQVRLGEAMKRLAPALDRISGSDRVAPADRQELRRAAEAVRAAAAAVPRNRERQPVTLGVTEPFVTTFTVTAYAALLLCLPFLLYQAYAFVLPAFSPSERRTAIPLMLMVPVLFIGGVAFGWFLALPRAVEFLQNFNDSSFDILIQARDYYRFSIMFLAAVGILFQIPVGVLAVTRLGIISARRLQKNRGYVILGVSVLAAVATPTPDPVTMLISMVPLVILFELSVALARVFERRRVWDDDGQDDHDEDDDGPPPDLDEDPYRDRAGDAVS